MLKEGDLRRRAFLRLATIGVAATQFGVFGTARAQSDESKPDEESEITYDNEAIVRQAYDFWYLRDGKIERFDCYIMFDTMRAQMGLS